MFSLEITLLGLALAMDAAAISFAMSLLQKDMDTKKRIQRGFTLSLWFGFFQFMMLWLGSYVGFLFTFSHFGFYFQFGVGLIFLGLAMKCFYESFALEDKELNWGLMPLLSVAMLTSIDALASGVSLATIPYPYIAGMEVGGITFLVCLSFYYLGQYFSNLPDRWLFRMAALIFAYLGLEILWSFRNTF